MCDLLKLKRKKKKGEGTCSEQQQVLLCLPASFARGTRSLGNHWNHQEPRGQAMLRTEFGSAGGFPPSTRNIGFIQGLFRFHRKKEKKKVHLRQLALEKM